MTHRSLHLIVLLFVLLTRLAVAQDLDLDPDAGGVADEALADLLADVAAAERGPLDLAKLAVSHWSEPVTWTGVKPAKHADADVAYTWRIVPSPGRVVARNRDGISPITTGAATTTLQVPAAGRYRIWLCYRTLRDRPQPVTMRLSGATKAEHIYGATAIVDTPGAEQEAAAPLRFDTALAREIPPPDKSLVWEYWDAELPVGEVVVSLTAPAKSQAAITDFLITQSMDFIPSRDPAATERNVDQVWYRVRIVDTAADAPERAAFQSYLLYRARHPRPDGKGEGLYQGRLQAPDSPGFVAEDGEAEVPVGQWSAWLNASEGTTNGGGPATLWLRAMDVTAGTIELEMAWVPHEAGVVARASSPVVAQVDRFRQDYGGAIFMAPVDTRQSRPPVAVDGVPIWGVRPDRYLAGLEDVGALEARIGEAIAEATAGRDTRVRHMRLLTHANPPEIAADATWRNLRALGLNWVSPPPDDPAAYDLLDGESLHAMGAAFMPRVQDPGWTTRLANSWTALATRRGETARPVLCVKLGDEVGMATSPLRINGDPDALADFRAYLAWELTQRGETPAFLGLKSLDEVTYPDALPDLAGRYDRRLRWFAWRYVRAATAAHYARSTAAVRAVFPQADTYVNLSPGFMFGQTYHTLWFDLPRAGATTLAWGEDWAWPTGGTATTGLPTVGFYGAILACAVRPSGRQIGFYTVAASGNADRKMFSLLPYRVFWQNIYSYGPAYLQPGQSDGWSRKSYVIEQIARATAALAPAEDRVVNGNPAPARTAILVNLTDDLWQRGQHGTLSEQLLTFIALRHAHTPVDLILDDDLTAERLAPYRVLHIGGVNLPRAAIPVLRAWVEGGGTLVAVAPVALRDEFDEAMPEGQALFGIRQTLVGRSAGSWGSDSLPEHEPIGTINMTASELTPELQAEPMIGPRVHLMPLENGDRHPTDLRVLANWEDGNIAAVRRTLGRGEILLTGYSPGLNYRATAPRDETNKARIIGWTAARRALITQPSLSRAGHPLVTASEPQVDVGVFIADAGWAITLTDYTWRPGEPLTLRLRPPAGKTPSSARSSNHGELKLERDGDDWLIHTVIPEPVDAILVDWAAK